MELIVNGCEYAGIEVRGDAAVVGLDPFARIRTRANIGMHTAGLHAEIDRLIPTTQTCAQKAITAASGIPWNRSDLHPTRDRVIRQRQISGVLNLDVLRRELIEIDCLPKFSGRVRGGAV